MFRRDLFGMREMSGMNRMLARRYRREKIIPFLKFVKEENGS